MTKPELIARLQSLNSKADPEAGHSRAETALLAFVNDPEIEAAWDAQAEYWWYA